MKIAIIPIGNSRGVRLPKQVLAQCGFGDAAEMSVEAGRIVLAPLNAPRADWAAQFGGADVEEDREWLDAPLTDDEDWVWSEDSTSGSSRSTR